MMLRLSVIAIGATLFVPAAAAAHSRGALGVDGPPEKQLRAFETQVLGPVHAAEHARARAAAARHARQSAVTQQSYRRCLKRKRKAKRTLRRARKTGTRLAPARRKHLRRLARKRCKKPSSSPTPTPTPTPLPQPQPQPKPGPEPGPTPWTGLAATGRWTEPFDIPVMAIHGAVLPTGKVLWFSYPKNPNPRHGGAGIETPNTTEAWLWDPATGTNTEVPPPDYVDVTGDGDPDPANIWCAGQTFLADGRLLVVGGNLAYETGAPENLDFKGLNKAYTFNPFNETWTEQPDMAQGRWYPTSHRLQDGRVVIVAGRDETGVKPGNSNHDVELFTPSSDMDGVGTMQLLGTADGSTGLPPNPGLYPHMFVLPSGRSLVAGPHPHDSWLLNPPGPTNAFDWLELPDAAVDRIWGTAVQLPGGPAGSTRVLQMGGSVTADPNVENPTSLPTKTTEFFDESDPAAGFQGAPPLNVARSHHNTVLLPDATMVTVGGGYGVQAGDQWAAGDEHKPLELWNPITGAWSLGPEQAENRAYHSIAMLLPDGRVISAGDDANGGPIPDGESQYYNSEHDTAEIYEPPYLFRGPRPTIGSAPADIDLGESFAVGTPDTNLSKAVLIAPSAVTHANDMNQRYVELAMAQGNGSVTLKAPASSDIAPPGYYMLFLVNSNGVPSVAKWVKLNGEAPVSATNLALGKAASATSENPSVFPEPPGTYAAENAVDGGLTTRWTSEVSDDEDGEEWWQVDLGTQQTISRVEIQWHLDFFASRYKVQTSTDGLGFTDAADVVNVAGGLRASSFPPRSARHVRVRIVTRAQNAGPGIFEARVFGPP